MLAALTVAVSLMLATAMPECLDPEGRSVDWWLIFKHPGGTKYAYADVHDKTFKTREDILEDKSSPLSKTILQAYDKSKSPAHAFWNDEVPHGHTVPSPWAHAKGVVAFDNHGGFWLTHSVPKFPLPHKRGWEHSMQKSWSTASTKYGQSFFCATVTSETMKQIGEAMLINMVNVYDAHHTASTDEAVPNFSQWSNINGRTFHKASGKNAAHHLHIHTKGKVALQVFAKSAEFGKDLWASLVAPTLGSSMITETWMNGKGSLGSSCHSAYQVMNSKAVAIAGEAWKDSQDHSKWGVTYDSEVFCIADINRQSGQFSRGGGAVCMKDHHVAGQLKAAVKKTQNCRGEVQYVTQNLRSGNIFV